MTNITQTEKSTIIKQAYNTDAFGLALIIERNSLPNILSDFENIEEFTQNKNRTKKLIKTLFKKKTS